MAQHRRIYTDPTLLCTIFLKAFFSDFFSIYHLNLKLYNTTQFIVLCTQAALAQLAVSKEVSSNTIEVDNVEQLKYDFCQEKRCVQKVVMEEKIEYDEVVECEHSYDKRCFTSLSTVYQPEQVNLHQIWEQLVKFL